MKTSDFYYDLPQELIGQHPIKNRVESRLMVLNREKKTIEHCRFKDIYKYLKKGDTLVLNDSRVLPARLYGNRPGKNEKIEILLLKTLADDFWETLVKPGRKAKIGNKIEFGHGLLKAEIVDISEEGNRFIKFDYEGIFQEILDELGQMPLPPYITESLEDKERYQTVYSKNPGSAAAPTAGLHFDKDLLVKLEENGVNIVYLTLHVGLGTFRPVKVDDVKDHHMHSEYYELSHENAQIINRTIENGGKIISVGTTTTRTLETLGREARIHGGSGWTDIFIYPGYKFEIVDMLITNFHLPESTLMMLVSAFYSKDEIMKAYEQAIKNKYSFFSFGDSMLII